MKQSRHPCFSTPGLGITSSVEACSVWLPTTLLLMRNAQKKGFSFYDLFFYLIVFFFSFFLFR